MQSKVQVLCEMLNNPKIHPKYAFTTCGIFDDAEEAYRVSQEYYADYQREQEMSLQEDLARARTEALQAGRSSAVGTESADGAVGGTGEAESST